MGQLRFYGVWETAHLFSFLYAISINHLKYRSILPLAVKLPY